MNKVTICLLLLSLLAAVFSRTSNAAKSPSEKTDSLWVYIGTYTNGQSEGIYLYELDLKTGKLSSRGLAAKTSRPPFLAIHPRGNYLYSLGESKDKQNKKTGAVISFSIDPKSGKLKELNHQLSQGQGPCHLVTDREGKNVLVANYSSGSVACLPIDSKGKLKAATSAIQHTGSSVNKRRQAGPHAHSINVDKTGKFAFAADLGIDKVLIYQLDSKSGKLTPNKPAATKVSPGAGPRHFAVHTSNKYCYVINELHCTITAFDFNAKEGSLKSIQTISTLPKNASGKNFSTAEVQVHPSGKFLYGSNRGHNSIAAFAINQDNGKLTHVENVSTQGKTPRNFGLDPTGKYLIAANQHSDTLVVFSIDQKTGKLTQVGNPVKCPTPVCVKFLKLGK